MMRPVLLVVFLLGCTMKGELDPKDLNKDMVCRDLRDGEIFEFNTNNVVEIRRGIGAPTSVTFKDKQGRLRVVTSEQEAFIKCAPKSSQSTRSREE